MAGWDAEDGGYDKIYHSTNDKKVVSIKLDPQMYAGCFCEG